FSRDWSSDVCSSDLIDLLLSMAHVPMERVNTIRLAAGVAQTPELWLRSYNGSQWLYFNADTGEQGLPADRLIWWFGEEPLISVEGGRNPQVEFTLNNSQINAIRLAQLSDAQAQAGF